MQEDLQVDTQTSLSFDAHTTSSIGQSSKSAKPEAAKGGEGLNSEDDESSQEGENDDEDATGVIPGKIEDSPTWTQSDYD